MLEISFARKAKNVKELAWWLMQTRASCRRQDDREIGEKQGGDVIV